MDSAQLQKDKKYLELAIEAANQGIDAGHGGPFGALVVKNNTIIATGCNMVTGTNDPTAHAEVVAIRKACTKLGAYQLTGCTIYASCEPCPMCLGAIYWARPDRLVFAASRYDAAAGGFDDDFIYCELNKPTAERKILTTQININGAKTIFEKWAKIDQKKLY